MKNSSRPARPGSKPWRRPTAVPARSPSGRRCPAMRTPRPCCSPVSADVPDEGQRRRHPRGHGLPRHLHRAGQRRKPASGGNGRALDDNTFDIAVAVLAGSTLGNASVPRPPTAEFPYLSAPRPAELLALADLFGLREHRPENPSANCLVPVCRADLVGHIERGEAQLITVASDTARRREATAGCLSTTATH